MTAVGCWREEQLAPLLNGRQRDARVLVGVATLGLAVLAARLPGGLGTVGAAGAGWFAASHLVAARTRYPGCPELGAIPSAVLGREFSVGCAPWRIADYRLGLVA